MRVQLMVGRHCVTRSSRAPLSVTIIACRVLYRRLLNVLADSSLQEGLQRPYLLRNVSSMLAYVGSYSHAVGLPVDRSVPTLAARLLLPIPPVCLAATCD